MQDRQLSILSMPMRNWENSVQVKRLPFLWTWMYSRNGGAWGYVQAGGIAKSIRWKDTSGSALYDLSGSAFAWGFNLSTRINMTKDIVLKVQGEYGTGIENYIADAGVDIGRETNPGSSTKPVTGKALPIFGLF